MRLRRSELSTPGSNERMMAKAAGSDADLVFLDLEDAVAPNQKDEARGKVIRALRELDWGKKTRAVRINGLETIHFYKDLIEVAEQAGDCLDIIIVPKIKGPQDVHVADTLLTQIEDRLGLKRRIGLEVLIEEVEAMITVETIAKSSNRLEALIFGPGDYSASQGIKLAGVGAGSLAGASADVGDIWFYARNKIIIAARAAGLDMIDGPYANFGNPDGYRQEAARACLLGASGKWAIHPSQIALANEVFSPTQQEVDQARKLFAAYEEAKAKGLGAVALEGVMVDEALSRILKTTLQKAELIGM